MKHLIAVFFFASLSSSVRPVQSRFFLLSDSMNGLPLGEYLHYYVDKSKALDISGLRALDEKTFQHSSRQFVDLGMIPYPVWGKLNIKNPGIRQKIWYLQFEYPHHDYIEFYQRNDATGQILRHRLTGDRTFFESRDIKYRKFIFVVESAASSSDTIYFRISGEQTLDLSLTAWTPAEALVSVDLEEKFLGFYFGAAVMLLLYNLFIFFSTRDLSYFYYCLFLLVFVANMIIYNGTGYQLLWPRSPRFNNSNCFFIVLNILATAQFGRIFLDLRKTTPVFERIVLLGMGVAAICLAFAVFDNGILLSHVSILLTLLMYLLLITAAVTAFLRKYRPAKFYLAGWCMVFLGLLLNGLKVESILPANFFTIHSMEIGSAFEMLFFSFALADRINILREENAELARLRVEDKKRIARDIHDVLGNEFSMRLMEIHATGDSERERKVAAGLRSTLQKIREFLFLLHAEENISEALISNITALLERLRTTGIFRVESKIDFPAHRFASSDAYHLERAVEESLSNLARHSKAGNATMRLYRRGKYGFFILADDGIGFDKNAVIKKGIGMESLQYRAERMRGKLRIFSTPNKGTIVALMFRV